MKYLIPLIFFLGLGFFLLSTIFYPQRLATEILLTPQWMFTEPLANHGADSGEYDWIPLHLNDELLFVNDSGLVGAREKQDFHLSYNRNSYVNISRNHSIFAIKNQHGDVRRVFESTFFPLLFDSGMVAISADGLELKIWDEEGAILLSHRWASLITTVDVLTVDGQMFSGVGLLDGRVYLFAGGEMLFAFEPELVDDQLSVVYKLLLHISQKGGRRFLHILTVEGFKPALLKNRLLSLPESGREMISLASVSSLVLPSQPNRSPSMEVLNSPNALLVLEDQGRALAYPLGRAIRTNPFVIDGQGDFQWASLVADLDVGIYWFSDSSQSGMEIRSSDNMLLFSSQKPFAAVAEVTGAVIYFWDAVHLAAYRLEEG